MNNSCLLTADRATHLKIVVVALVCAIVVACVGIASRLGESNSTRGRFETSVVKPAQPLTAATASDRTIR